LNSVQRIPKASVIIPTYNEESYITGVLQSLIDQDFQGHIEIVIVDGASNDRTVAIAKEIRNQLPVNRSIVLVTNPKRHIPVSLNMGCGQAQADILVRLDGHTFAPVNYITEVVDMLANEEADTMICGGRLNIQAGAATLAAEAITIGVSHPVGIGNALYRTLDGSDDRCIEVDTVPFASFTKKLWTELGGFDEFLLYDEDSDFNSRAKRKGCKVILNPRIVFKYFSRPTLTSLTKQYYRYGYWVSKFLVKHKMFPTLRKLAPITFLMALVTLGFIHIGLWLFIFLTYSTVIVIISFREAVVKRKNIQLLFQLIPIFPALHLSYGIGNVIGLFTSFNNPFQGKPFINYK
jgi:succinoglycan biosynthesis protein ExoA